MGRLGGWLLFALIAAMAGYIAYSEATKYRAYDVTCENDSQYDFRPVLGPVPSYVEFHLAGRLTGTLSVSGFPGQDRLDFASNGQSIGASYAGDYSGPPLAVRFTSPPGASCDLKLIYRIGTRLSAPLMR